MSLSPPPTLYLSPILNREKLLFLFFMKILKYVGTSFILIISFLSPGIKCISCISSLRKDHGTHKEHQINFHFVSNLNKFRNGWWHFHWTWRHRVSGGRGITEDVLEWKTFGGREMDEKSILSKSQLKEHRTALWFFSSLISFTCRISLNLSSILPILICCQELFCSKV